MCFSSLIVKSLKIPLFFSIFLLSSNVSFQAYAQESPPVREDSLSNDMDDFLSSITEDEQSSLEKKVINQKKYAHLPNFVSLYKINYLLPYYYTESPYREIYTGNTPEKQTLMQAEFKGQFSLEVPLIQDLFYNEHISLHASYTQQVFWQIYASSQYFRETDYEPTLFLNYHLYRNWLTSAGFSHQSNGKGGSLERSWNRVFGTVQFSGVHWYTKIDVWSLVFQGESSALHNDDIEKYLGHEHIILGYKISDFVFILELQNIESGMEKGYFLVSASYPLTNQLNFYTQYFDGYGQSLIEYDHRTRAFGLGVSFNSWL